MNVSEFTQRALDLNACESGIRLFMGKKGSVIKRIRKMCEIANRRWDTLTYGDSNGAHRSALNWFYDYQHYFYDRGISLGFALCRGVEDGFSRYWVEVIHD